MSEIPAELRRAVITEVYRQADQLDWDTLPDRRRTQTYDQWVNEAAIGGQLTRFQSRERARVWLKDVPMKEYVRARNGIGPFADLVASRFPGPGQIVGQVMGDGWAADERSIEEKPLRCVVFAGGVERLMIWGPPGALSALVWAGIVATDEQRPKPVLVVTVPYGAPLDDGEKRRNVRLGKIAGLEVLHTVLRATKIAT